MIGRGMLALVVFAQGAATRFAANFTIFLQEPGEMSLASGDATGFCNMRLRLLAIFSGRPRA